MDSSLGWSQIARSDVAKATELLKGSERGVRDEIGFLTLHQGFSDRFFPGTSVLQTRLRYALFVPWQIQDLADQRVGSAPASVRLQKAERELVLRLKLGTSANEDDDGGVIGIRSENFQPAQPPAYVYWTALRLWGILDPVVEGVWPGRAEILARIDGAGGLRDERDDETTHVRNDAFFFALPERPRHWYREGGAGLTPLNFQLPFNERKYLRDRLVSVRRCGAMRSDADSLLARLAAVKSPKFSWKDLDFDSDAVKQIADAEDRDALAVAHAASSLTRIGRSVYGALIEYIAQKCDKRKAENQLHKRLAEAVSKEKAIALTCRLDEVAALIGPLDPKFSAALAETLIWLKGNTKDVADLWPAYKASEEARKDSRARLPNTPRAAVLRAVWLAENARESDGLNYRWHRVSQLLDDLHGGKS